MIEGPGELLRRHGLSPRKSWGQNFLHDPHVLANIAAAAGTADTIIEIGAGLGTLTARLLETGAVVHAVERDRDLCAVLRAEFAGVESFTLHEADAVQFDYRAFGDDVTIVGNLPYHLTGPLLFRLLESAAPTGPWIVMVQKEVADRLMASPGSKRYGGTTVAIGRQRMVTPVVAAPRGAFLPPPRVDSTVIRLDPRPRVRGEVPDEAAFLALVRTAFQGRRKTIVNALSRLASRGEVEAWCRDAGVDPGLRPERLTAEDFAGLARARGTPDA